MSCSRRSGRARWRAAAFVTCALALGATGARAQDAPSATVRLDGRSVLRVDALDTLSARQRADAVEERLSRLVASAVPVSAATVETRADSTRVITVSGVPVIALVPQDARNQGLSPDGLAAEWAGAIDEAVRAARSRRETTGSRFAAEVRASIRTAFARIAESALTIVPRFLAALVVLLLFWVVAAAVRALMRVVFRRVIDDLTVENLIRQVTYYAVWMLGIAVAIGALGFEAETVITGLGLTGLALGFALKDILSNFVSGLILLVLRPFRVGDQIVVGETEGTVQRIELRATQIRTYDGRIALVPNAELFTSRVINNTATPIRRGAVEFVVGYGEDLRKVSDVARTATATAQGVLADPAPSVRVRALGAEDLHLEARFWTDSRRSDFMDTASAVRAALVERLRAEGIALPDPALRVVERSADRYETSGERRGND